MKTLFLLRHAKSSWSDPTLGDFDRPLKGRGRKAAAKMGAFMAAEGLRPDLVLSSSSARTRETFALFENALGDNLDVQFMDDLYASSSILMLNLVQNARSDVGSLMLIAHNPGMHDATLRFLGDATSFDKSRLDYNFPTCGLAQFSFSGPTWQDVNFGEGKLELLVFPKDL